MCLRFLCCFRSSTVNASPPSSPDVEQKNTGSSPTSKITHQDFKDSPKAAAWEQHLLHDQVENNADRQQQALLHQEQDNATSVMEQQQLLHQEQDNAAPVMEQQQLLHQEQDNAAPVMEQQQLQNLDLAAITIQRIQRGYASRQQVKQLIEKKEPKYTCSNCQSHGTKNSTLDTEKAKAAQQQAATTIQRYFRQFQARTLVQNLQQERHKQQKREIDATTIQRIQRGISAKQQFKKLKVNQQAIGFIESCINQAQNLIQQKREVAATTIQRIQRGISAKQQFKKLKVNQQAIGFIESCINQAQNLIQQKQAATTIQCYFRQFQSRSLLQNLQHQRHQQAIGFIESCINQAQNLIQQEQAATTIQCYFRQFQSRSLLQNLHQEQGNATAAATSPLPSTPREADNAWLMTALLQPPRAAPPARVYHHLNNYPNDHLAKLNHDKEITDALNAALHSVTTSFRKTELIELIDNNHLDDWLQRQVVQTVINSDRRFKRELNDFRKTLAGRQRYESPPYRITNSESFPSGSFVTMTLRTI